jgi:hypothetical protein
LAGVLDDVASSDARVGRLETMNRGVLGRWK